MVELLVVGLGNPGPRYAQTRHNVGFMWVDHLAERLEAGPWRSERWAEVCEAEVAARRVRLVKPSTYMNASGDAIAAELARTRLAPERLWIAHDDLDLPFGCVRFKVDGGSGGHNGLRSIEARIGRKPFRRVRFGIGHPGKGADIVGYVLGRFSPVEEELLPELLERAEIAWRRVFTDGWDAAVQWLHSQPIVTPDPNASSSTQGGRA